MRKTALAVVLIAFLAPTAALPQAKSGKGGVYEQLNLFGEAFERIRQDAVQTQISRLDCGDIQAVRIV